MNEDYAALADLVGQLLAARWIEEQDEAQAQDLVDDGRPSPASVTDLPFDYDAD